MSCVNDPMFFEILGMLGKCRATLSAVSAQYKVMFHRLLTKSKSTGNIQNTC